MVAGETYAIRWRSGLSDLDPIGTSTVRTVVTAPGVTDILTLSGSGLLPVAGDLVHFGLAASESFRVVVTGVERAQDNASILRLVDAADDPVTGIDALVEAATVPEWSSRVGAEVDPSLLAPAVPHFAGIAHGMAGTGDPDLIALLIAAGAGSTVPAAEFQVGHRPSGGGAFTVVSLPAADGGCEIAAYAEGDAVDLRVQALSSGGHASGWSTTVTITIGSADLPAPGALNAGDITVATRIGGATITVITPADANLARLQVYRSATGSLNRATDAYGAPVAAEGARSYVLPVGDQTRVNLIANGDMSSASGWTVPADVTIASGVATKVAGAASRHLTQAPTLTAGETLRVAYRVPSFTAGNARVRALGTTSVDAIVATAAGSYRGTLVVPASPGAIGIFFNTAAAMTVDDVLIYRPTAACLPQGTQYLWLEPQNAEGTPGPVSGPFAITID